ncbi:MAG TPA: DUF2934 domain-containing protein [Acidobacteriaceae bacterium]|nr:DUF2934 domain-containing protein [Acidobacteriaceae bacterium]
MATKKAASKKTAGTEAVPEKTAAKKAPAKKTAAKKTPEKPAATEAAEAAPKGHPSHHDISVRAYLLWERDGKKHGHHDHYWKQAEKELLA